MRLIKNKLIGENLIEVQEIQWIKQRKTNKKNLIQYCELPEVKELSPYTKYKRFDSIDWTTEEIDMRLVCKPKNVLWKITEELILQNKINDDRKWKMKRKLNLVAYILELAYNLGLLNSHTNLAKNESTKHNKQKESKDIDSVGSEEPRKEKITTKKAESNKSPRNRRRRKTTKTAA